MEEIDRTDLSISSQGNTYIIPEKQLESGVIVFFGPLQVIKVQIYESENNGQHFWLQFLARLIKICLSGFLDLNEWDSEAFTYPE
jgi:hypothetical protein